MCASYNAHKHDLGLVRTDLSTVGLMLAKNRDRAGNEGLSYRTFDDEYLAQQQTESPSYNNLPVEKSLKLVIDDWVSGFGKEVYDSNDPKRYYESIDVDGRFENMLIAGPKNTEMKPAITQWRTPTSWTDGDSAWSTEDNILDKDTATAATAVAPVSSWGSYLEANVYATICDKVQYYFGDPGADITSCNIEVFYTGAWHSILNGLPTWGALTELAIGSTQTVTAARINFWNSHAINTPTTSINEIQFNIATAGSLLLVNCAKKFNALQYIANGVELWKLNSGATGLTHIRAFPATITDLEVFGANLYIALGWATSYQYMDTSEAFTTTTGNVKTMKWFCTVKAAVDTLYGSQSVNHIISTADPTGAATWAADTVVDSANYDIVEMMTRGNVLYMIKEDRTFYLDSSANIKVLVDETQKLADRAAGKKATIFLDDLYLPWGDQGLLWYDTSEDAPTFIDPSDFVTNSTAFDGAVLATTSDERYLYAVVDDGTNVEVLAGRLQTIDGAVKRVWHPISQIALTDCNTAFYSNVTKRRVYFGSTTGLFYIPSTATYGNITGDTNYTYESAGYLITPWYHFDFKGDKKGWFEITLEMSGTSSTVYWEAHYQILGDTTWTEINSTDKFKTSPTTSAYIPADSGSTEPSSQMMRFKFVCVTGAAASTPVLKSVLVRGKLYPSNRGIIDCEVLCDEDIVLKDGSPEKGQSAAIKAAIEEARAATWPVSIYDLDDTTTTKVSFLPTSSVALRNEEKPFKRERRYRLVMQKESIHA